MEDWKTTKIEYYRYAEYDHGGTVMETGTITKERLYQDFIARMLSDGYIVKPQPELRRSATCEDLTKKPANKRFQPPTIEEVKQHCKEKGIKVDPVQFVNFYEAKGWMIGKNKMKSWKAAIQTWKKSEPEVKLAAAHKPYKPS